MNIGGRLKALRDAFGWTLSDVESRTNIGLSSLSDFENGKREPMLSHLKKLAEVYQKPISFFLETGVSKEPVLLWRKKPEPSKAAQLEAKFVKLCRQYKNLEVWTKNPKMSEFDQLFIAGYPKEYNDVRKLACDTCKRMDLGSRPGESLFRVLEEVYAVKIFNLDLKSEGSSACIYTEDYGPAIMLNRESVQWRRNFDLAHELFHLITWKARADVKDPGFLESKDEKYANYFASVLLMPEEPLKEAVESYFNEKKEITFADLDSVARQFGVSLEALFWRIHYVYGTAAEQIEKWIAASKMFNGGPLRKSDAPGDLPERYKNLALTALMEGLMSSRQFANYLDINPADVYSYQKLGKSDGIKIKTGTF